MFQASDDQIDKRGFTGSVGPVNQQHPVRVAGGREHPQVFVDLMLGLFLSNEFISAVVVGRVKDLETFARLNPRGRVLRVPWSWTLVFEPVSNTTKLEF